MSIFNIYGYLKQATNLTLLQFELSAMNEEHQVTILPDTFDDKPIGNKAKFQIPEYADNQNPIAAEVVNPQPIPLAKRLASKVIKAKRDALDQLLVQSQQNKNAFQPYINQTIQLITNSAIIVQQRALKLVLLFLNGGGNLTLDPKIIIKVIIQKCLTINKQEIKNASENILFWYMDNNHQDLLLEQLKGQLLSKNPKIIGISLLYIAKLLNNYGIKRMKGLQRFYKYLQLMSAQAKPLAKAQIIEFYKQVYRWMGENIFKEFKIHHEVKDQLVKFAKDFKKEPLQIKRGIKIEQLNGQMKKQMEIQNIDNKNSHIEPLDVLSQYNSTWVDQTLSIQKWKEKKAVLDDFIKKINVPAIIPKQSENSAYIKLIKTLVVDNNILIMLCGFSITQNLAKGLKKHFSFIGKNIKGYIFDRLKNGKPNIVEVAQKTLKDLLSSLTLEDLMTQIKAGLEDKAPNMRKQVLKFLGNFTARKQPKIMSIMKDLLQKLAKMLDDGSAQVRLETLQLLCSIKKTHDMKFFTDKLKNINEAKLTTIRNVLTQTTIHEPMEIQTVPIITAVQTFMIDETNNSLKEINPGKENIKFNKNKTEDTSVKLNNVPFSGIDTWLPQLSSPHESVRQNGYQQIASKCPNQKNAINKIKSKAIKEFSPAILRVIIQIIKKFSNNQLIELDALQFLCMHDWKKCKPIFIQFIQSNKFSFAAQDFMKNNNAIFSNIIKNNEPIKPPTPNHTFTTLKSLTIEFTNLIHKISSPSIEVKIEGVQKAIKIIQMLPKIGTEHDLVASAGWNQELMNQFYGIVKFRISEPLPQITTRYCKLLQLMIQKGIATINRGLKLIVPTVMAKLKDGQPEIKHLLNNLTESCPSYIFSLTLIQVCTDINRISMLEFIIQRIDIFLKNANLKNFLGPLLHIVSNVNLQPRLKINCQKLLDQLVELCGEVVLQSQARRLKIINAEQYLAKFNITISSSNSMHSIPKNINHKTDRLKMDEQNPWPITVTPSLILQLINIMLSMKEPLPQLITPLTLRTDQINLINSFQKEYLVDNSDLLLKWAYWRTVIDPKEQVKQVLKISSRIVMCLYFALTEGEVIILLSSLINVLKRFHQECLPYVQDICKKLFSIGNTLKQLSFRFWVNSLFDDTIENTPVSEILQIFISCYSDMIAQQLVNLARNPAVVKNQRFIQFISSKFTAEMLNVSGFKNIGIKTTGRIPIVQPQLKTLLSDLGGPQNMINIDTQERMFYVTLFQKSSSVQLMERLNQILSRIDPKIIVQSHLKIIYSIVVPFMKREISIINLFTYFKYLNNFMDQTLGNISIATGAPKVNYALYLKDLTRVVVFFLIDLDQNAIENKTEVLHLVNKIILQLLSHSGTRHMLQILFLLLKNQINANVSTKILHLLIKCMTKVCKDKKFELNEQGDLTFIVNETNNILKQNKIDILHPLITSLNKFFGQLQMYPKFKTIINKLYEDGQACQCLIKICKEGKIIPNQNNDLCEIKQKPQELMNPIRQIGVVAIPKMMSMKKNQNRDL